MPNYDVMAQQLVRVMREQVAQVFDAVSARLDTCEQRINCLAALAVTTSQPTVVPVAGPPGADGRNGKDGESIDPAALQKLVDDAVAEVAGVWIESEIATLTKTLEATIRDHLASIPVPKDGERGADGKDGKDGVGVDQIATFKWIEEAVAEVADKLDALVREQLSLIPVPKDGKDGAPGKDGIFGKDGAPGRDGKDADPAVIEELRSEVKRSHTAFESLARQIDALKILPPAPASFLINEEGMLQAIYPDGSTKSIGRVRGENGKDGERGAAVMDGDVNDQGMLVLRMSDGRIINTGVVRGERGRDGKDGDPGTRGREAHEITILPGIDETRSYPQGTVAKFRGGTIHADRQTDPIVDGLLSQYGWSVVLNGIADERENVLDDGRVIVRETDYTDGHTYKRVHETVTPIHRGIWREGVYKRGDMVQRSGSVWACVRATSSEPGNGAPDWVLSTKKGADGRDGKDGKSSEPVRLRNKDTD